VKSDYDENIYTTTIDRTNPLYKQRLANAERIAREIENSSAMNSHVAEERGYVVGDDSGMDEEDK
jgi:PAB1-binding protein PBP1